jgi:hypothetical protein
METIRFSVTHTNGRIEELLTESAQVLVGSGAHCEIRLPIDQARVEHVLIQSTPAGLRAIARAFDPPPRLDGAEFTQAPILGRAVLAIGETKIEVSPSMSEAARRTTPRAQVSRNPRVYAYLVLGAAGVVTMLAARGKGNDRAAEPFATPALWGARVDHCPQAVPDQALAAARARLSLAIAKRERSPFHPEDGVAAVPMYEGAEACFRAAGRDGDAADAAGNAEQLRHRMTEEFREHRIRLRRAMSLQEWPIAVHESGVLLSFLPSGGSDYATWLSNLRRKLQLQYESKKNS